MDTIWADCEIFIPENDRIPESGYFKINDIVEMLRRYSNEPDKVYFIADMLEI